MLLLNGYPPSGPCGPVSPVLTVSVVVGREETRFFRDVRQVAGEGIARDL